jgi:hypothetical protein
VSLTVISRVKFVAVNHAPEQNTDVSLGARAPLMNIADSDTCITKPLWIRRPQRQVEVGDAKTASGAGAQH